jgi:hypothetical protein
MFLFSTFLLGLQTSSVHLYSTRLRPRYRRSILTAPMRPYLYIIGCPEMTHITITDSYYALRCYRRGNILFLPAKTVTFQPLPSDFTVGPYSRRFLFYTLARPCLRSLRHSILSRSFLHCYEIFQIIVVRYYTSLLLRLHFIVTRDYTSLLLRLHFIVAQITLHCCSDYTSLLLRLHFIVAQITLHCYERLSI